MGKVRVAAFSVSLDGFGAGLRQDLQNPLGLRGLELHAWFVQTEAFKKMQGKSGGKTGIDSDVAAQSFENVGAWILGRNMFGPIRGPWKDDSWKGWWGTNPPYHTPVFVLTHYPRPPLAMEGGTTFHFVTDGIEAALEQAKEISGGKDVRIGGGVSTIRQYLASGLIDEMHLAFSPVTRRRGAPVQRDESSRTRLRAIQDHHGRVRDAHCSSKMSLKSTRIASLVAPPRSYPSS